MGVSRLEDTLGGKKPGSGKAGEQRARRRPRVTNPLHIDCSALMCKTVFWLGEEALDGTKRRGTPLEEDVRAMRLTEADVWIIVPMGLAVAFMVWFIWKLAGQIKGR